MSTFPPPGRVRVQVELSFDDVLASISTFSAEQKQRLFEQLRIDAFRQQAEQLTAEIPAAGFSEEEIMEEVRAVRYGKA